MTVPLFVNSIVQKLKEIPRHVWIIAVVAFFISTIGLDFFIPKQVTFSYSGETCIRHLALAPDLQRKTGGEQLEAQFKGGLTLFNQRITSTKLCVTPVQSPEQEDVSFRVALLGIPVPSKQIQVTIPEAPKAAISTLSTKSISAAREISIPLSAKDTLHSFSIQVADKKAECTSKTDAQLSCDLPALQLAHGTDYTLALNRSFKEDATQKIGEVAIKTVPAIQMTGGTVSDGQIIYDKPAELKLGFDAELATATAELLREDGDKKTAVQVDVSVVGSEVIVKPAEQLPRNAQFILTLKDAESKSGSTLSAPLVVRFTTSGGPKPISVSVGGSGVAQGAQIIVTFDQMLKSDFNVAAFARTTGVEAAVRKLNDTQIVFTLQGAPLCAGFSLVVDKGVPSGSNDEVSTDPWKFDSRTVCGYSRQIGTSVRGRPIIAYYFGNGANTLLFTGAIHGSEVSSYTTMQALVTYLQSTPAPADKRIVVVPNTNPDGVAAGTRNNANNVNVDRNFPASNWSASIDTAAGILPQGGGTSPGSEPEAQALITLTRQLRPRLSISYHSQGRLVGANKYGDSVSIGNIYASTVGYSTMFDNAEDVMGYSITGEYEDWMGEEMGTPAILIELPSHSGNYLNSQMNAIKKMLAV